MRYLIIAGVLCLALTGCVVQEGPAPQQSQQQPIIVNPPQQPIIINNRPPCGPCRPSIGIGIGIGVCPGGCHPGCPHHHH
jgi:hypothetical protein